METPPATLLGLSLSPLLLAGCSALGGGDDSGSRPQVVAAFYPYAYVAERVAGENATVTNLTAPGLEPHDLELTPRQVADISEADLLVYEEGFQPAVDEAVDQSAEGTTLDVTDVVPLQDTGVPAEADLSGDPHLWQDPTLLMPIAEQVRDDLLELNPDNAAAYKANAKSLVADLTKLDTDITAGLADCQRTEFVTSHAAFGYLANRYDLTMVPIAGLSPDIEPSPEQVAEVQDYIESAGITTVFSEALGSKEYADTLANDLGVQTAVLDSIEGLADEDSDDDYISLMRKNLAALQKANDCS
ncbi:MAG: metal ABC transporter substrate-binding protein [Actinomycetota bacterium]|nr:metal ABC transporter substrate-binding protein [Actinomycetota bacterium]